VDFRAWFTAICLAKINLHAPLFWWYDAGLLGEKTMTTVTTLREFLLHTKNSKKCLLDKCNYAIDKIENLQSRLNETSNPANYSAAVSCAISALESGVENATQLAVLLDYLMKENEAKK
jgi:hypothetical protein